MLLDWHVIYVCRIPRLYEQFRLKIDEGDHDKDLKFWSDNHGVGMPMYWPTFEVQLTVHSVALYSLSSIVDPTGVAKACHVLCLKWYHLQI